MDSIHCRLRRWDFLSPMYRTFMNNIPKNVNLQKKKNTYNDCFQVTSLLNALCSNKNNGKIHSKSTHTRFKTPRAKPNYFSVRPWLDLRRR